MRCLLARTTLTVDGGAGHGLGPASGEHSVAGNVHTLLAHLHDAAHDHIVDEGRVDTSALDECLHGFGGEVDRVPVLQLAVAATERGTDGVDDDCSGHGELLGEKKRWVPLGNKQFAVYKFTNSNRAPGPQH